MVYLYYCQACEDGRHKDCELGHPAPPGVYGGSKCRCACSGRPLWNDPDRIHAELMEKLRQLERFEVKSQEVNLIVGGNKHVNQKTPTTSL